MTQRALNDRLLMVRALELARRGQGLAEPNPLVGCVIAKSDRVLGEGWHRRYGGPHAESDAISSVRSSVTDRDHGDSLLRGATAYVNLEPCCHHGKTPPCTQALIEAGVARVVMAMADPFAQVAGKGIDELRDAGIEVDVGILESAARELNAPYLKLLQQGKPWVIAKWAMTLDGKLATRTRHSQWISNPQSREIVHRLRGRVDGIMIGSGTARADNPMLTARPNGLRCATRIVLDSNGSIDRHSQLVQTARQVPLLIVASPSSLEANRRQLEAAGCEVLVHPPLETEAGKHDVRRRQIEWLLDELGKRRMTNLLVEGGGELLGSLFDSSRIDEVHAFIAPKLAGGHAALSPVLGQGIATMNLAKTLDSLAVRELDGDIYVSGRTV